MYRPQSNRWFLAATLNITKLLGLISSITFSSCRDSSLIYPIFVILLRQPRFTFCLISDLIWIVILQTWKTITAEIFSSSSTTLVFSCLWEMFFCLIRICHLLSLSVSLSLSLSECVWLCVCVLCLFLSVTLRIIRELISKAIALQKYIFENL